jgi:(S)-ureidoglycine aminohydrolase
MHASESTHNLGSTRSVNRRDHLLLTPDTFVRTPLPGLTKGAAIVHAAPQVGAGFTMMTVEMDPGGELLEGPTQRFVYVLEGELGLYEPDSGAPHELRKGSYAFCPQDLEHHFEAESKARIAVIDKPMQPLDQKSARSLADSGERDFPWFVCGHEEDGTSVALNGDEGLQVRSLLPNSMAFDFACNTMTYAPGAALSQVEIHYMEHGLLMLEGGGIYRLGDEWYPTKAGDFIWMAPFCPQWFGAIGKQPAKYLIYKDFNRHTLG